MKGFIRNRIPLIAMLFVFLLSGADDAHDIEDAEYYCRSGKEKYHNSKFREAVEDYDRAAAFSPGTAKIFGSRAAA
jgi:hypothetical protein